MDKGAGDGRETGIAGRRQGRGGGYQTGGSEGGVRQNKNPRASTGQTFRLIRLDWAALRCVGLDWVGFESVRISTA